MNDNVHPLRAAYINIIRSRYHQFPTGDKNPGLTERTAKVISDMGLTFDTYMDVAVRLCDGIAKFKGWAYPYYNVVIGQKTLDKIQKMLDYTDVRIDNPDDVCLFEEEMCYASSYIDWWFGRGPRPRREHDTPVSIRGKVAEALCLMYGIAYTSSNYNLICRALEKNGH